MCLLVNVVCSQIHWNYCILDEGHVIKNSKTKVPILFLTIVIHLHSLLISYL